nr:hypothetical protein [uncultured Acidovorax sp.]
MDSQPFAPVHPDDYHRLREAVKRHALQLRQEAIRDASAWAAGVFRGAVRRALQSLRCETPLHRAPGALRRSRQEP